MQKLTIEKAVSNYYNEHVLAECIDKRRILFACERLINFFGDMLVSRLEHSDIARYVRTRNVGGGTVRRELGALQAALNYAVDARDIDRVPSIKMPKAPEPKSRWLTAEEAGRLIEASLITKLFGAEVKNQWTRVYMFVMIALNTGARKSAIEELRWEQVDLENRLIHFNPEGRVQTKKRRPVVPISDELHALLIKCREGWANWEAWSGTCVIGHSGCIRKAFDNAVKRAGLTRVTPHTLRHTWATWAAQAGVSLWDIAGVLGDDEGTVRKRYAHHSPDHLRAAVNFRSK